MGGMVARTMMTLANYRKDSVNTMITLAAPHSLPPATLDEDSVKLYHKVNKYWEEAFSQEPIGRNPLASVSLISITGGGLDHMIPSDHSSISSIVPSTNGFTVLTSSIPYVWSAIDHQAIVWCDQFRQVLSRSLMEIIDVTSSFKTKALVDRMNIFRNHFLSGLEAIDSIDGVDVNGISGIANEVVGSTEIVDLEERERIVEEEELEPDTLVVTADFGVARVPYGDKLRINQLGSYNSPITYLMTIPKYRSIYDGDALFTLLTDRRLVDKSNRNMYPSSAVYALACRYPRYEQDIANSMLSVVDLTSLSRKPLKRSSQQTATGLLCKNLAPYAAILPKATSTSLSASPNEFEALSYIQYNTSLIDSYDFITIVDANEYATDGFIISQVEDAGSTSLVVKSSLWKTFMLGGQKVHLPSHSVPMMIDISFQSIWSSLLTFTLTFTEEEVRKNVENISDGKRMFTDYYKNKRLFYPFVRQYVEDPYESKYFLSLHDGSTVNVSMFGLAPFAPFNKYHGYEYNNLHIQLWSDRGFRVEDRDDYVSSNRVITLTLKLDVMNSLGKLVLHYRQALVVFPVCIMAIVLIIQCNIYASDGVFISVGDSLRIFSKRYLFLLIAFTAILPIVVPFVEGLFYLIAAFNGSITRRRSI